MPTKEVMGCRGFIYNLFICFVSTAVCERGNGIEVEAKNIY